MTHSLFNDHDNSLYRWHFSRNKSSREIMRLAPPDFRHPVSGKSNLETKNTVPDFYYDTTVSRYPAYYSMMAVARGLQQPSVPLIRQVSWRNARSTGNDWQTEGLSESSGAQYGAVDIRVEILRHRSDDGFAEFYVSGPVDLLIDGIKVATQYITVPPFPPVPFPVIKSEFIFEDIPLRSSNAFLLDGSTRISFSDLVHIFFPNSDMLPITVGQLQTIMTPSRYHRVSMAVHPSTIFPPHAYDGSLDTLPIVDPNTLGPGETGPYVYETGFAFLTVNDPYTVEITGAILPVNSIGTEGFNFDSGNTQGWLLDGTNSDTTNIVDTNDPGHEHCIAFVGDSNGNDNVGDCVLGVAERTIDTSQWERILITYDIKVNSQFATYPNTTSNGTPGPVHGGEDPSHALNYFLGPQLYVDYSTAGSATRKETVSGRVEFDIDVKDTIVVETLTQQRLVDYKTGWSTRTIDLSIPRHTDLDESHASNKSGFTLRFLAQLNNSNQGIYIDNIRVYGIRMTAKSIDRSLEKSLANASNYIWTVRDEELGGEIVAGLKPTGQFYLVPGTDIVEGFSDLDEDNDRILWQEKVDDDRKLALYWDASSEHYVLAISGNFSVKQRRLGEPHVLIGQPTDLASVGVGNQTLLRLDESGNLMVRDF